MSDIDFRMLKTDLSLTKKYFRTNIDINRHFAGNTRKTREKAKKKWERMWNYVRNAKV